MGYAERRALPLPTQTNPEVRALLDRAQRDLDVVAQTDSAALMEWIAANRAEAEALYQEHYQARIALARRDVNTFIELVGISDNDPDVLLVQAPHHEEMQRLANEHPRLVLWSFAESAKSTQLSVLRILWKLGNNPRLRIAIISNTQAQAAKFLTAIKQYIEKSAVLREVFPNLTPGTQWAATAITVKRDVYSRDPSVQAIGVHGALLGARLDDVVMDDIIDFENARTPEGRSDLLRWIVAVVLTRLTDGASICAVGTPWHPEDAMHELAKLPGWHSAVFPVRTDDGTLTWPEQWPHARIDAAAAERGPLEAARTLYCRARDDAQARWHDDWIVGALQKGLGRSYGVPLKYVPDGYLTVTGVDLGTRDAKHARARQNARTVIFTLCVRPDDTREVLNIEEGQWSAPIILQRLASTHERFHSTIFVESNAAQIFVTQFAKGDKKLAKLPIKEFITGGNKWDPVTGVESLAVEMSRGEWVIPCSSVVSPPPAVVRWISEMRYYNPSAHTGDALMSCVAPGQLVTTENGLVPIEQVQVGTQVLTHRGRWRTVLATASKAWSGSLVRIRARGMSPLLVTPEHRVWRALPRRQYDYNPDKIYLRPDEGSWAWERADALCAGRKLAGDYVLAPIAPSDAALAVLAEPRPEEVARWGAQGWRGRERTNAGSLVTPDGVAVRLAGLDTVPYDGPVYDLQVEEDESFVVQQLAVHNCWIAREGVRSLRGIKKPPPVQYGRINVLKR